MKSISISIEALALLTKKSVPELEKLTKKEDGTTDQEPTEISKAVEQLIKDRFNEIGKDNHGRGTREALTAKQKAIAQKYGIVDAHPTIEELFDAIVEAEKAKGGNNGEAASQLAEQKEEIKRLKNEVKDHKAQLEKATKDRERDKIMFGVNSQIERELVAMGVVLPEDADARARAISMFSNSLTNGKNFQNKDGKFIVLKENGEPEQDENYTDLDLSAYVKKHNVFPIKQNQPPQNPVNPKGTPNGGAFTFIDADLVPTAYVKKYEALTNAGKHDEAAALKAAFTQKIDGANK